MTIHIGTSGWSYDHWQGLLYPENTPVGKRLPYYLARYDTVEVNSTYYRWPADSVFAGWNRLPAGFVMTVKAARGLSHYARLNNPQEWMERMAQGIAGLGEHMGVLLVQLPPQFACDYDALEGFLRRLPPGLKVAVEFRHLELAYRGGFRAAGALRRGVLRDERRAPALRSPRHRAVRLRPLSRPGHQLAIRRLLLRRRSALVGRPLPRVAGAGPRHLRLLQQRRRRQRPPQRQHAQTLYIYMLIVAQVVINAGDVDHR